MPTKLSPIGITTTGNHPLNKQHYVEIAPENEEIFNDVKKELEVESIDYDETYYIEMTKDHDGWKSGDKLSILGSEYFAYRTAGACKKITKDEFKKREEKVINVTKDPVKDLLNEERLDQEVEKYEEKKINWIDDSFFDDWDKIKGHVKKILGHCKTYDLDSKVEPFKKIFLAHSRDTIEGKPQLASQTQIPLPLIKEIVEKVDDKNDENKEVNLYKYVFFDEKVDGRSKGYQRDSFSLDFRLYYLIDADDKPYWLFSQEKLPFGTCTFKGMIVEAEHLGELNKSFKLPTKSRVFFVKEFEPAVKILSKEKIVEFTKTREMTEKDWIDTLDYHKNGNFNRFVPERNALRSAFILSGLRDGYPLHIQVWGNPGTNKSKGDLETLDYKFHENPNILGGGNSRIKMLTPSFKEKPANLGYLAKCERIGMVDEVGKMIEFELNKHQTSIQNILGDCNLLYDHDEQVVGSGNDNEARVKSTAKYIMVSNPVSSKQTIYAHVGMVDPTNMSRNIIWVIDREEQDFIFSGKAIERTSPHTLTNIYTEKLRVDITNKQKNNPIFLYVGGKLTSREEFLTLFDTCNSFTCEVDETLVRKLFEEITFLAREPMKSSVWKPRGEHHVYLLVDGLCKHRCLFKDYDATFTPKPEDYDLAERILVRMVKSWDTDLSPKKEVWN
jgi:hypothetical protein